MDRFADAKKKKGYLPGENENIQVQLYENRSESMKTLLILINSFSPAGVVEEDPNLQITEEAVKSLKYVQIAKYDTHGDEIEQPDTS